MKIFKDKITETEKINDINIQGTIIYPKTQDLGQLRYKDFGSYTISTLYKLIEYDEYINFMKVLAENFVSDYGDIIHNLKNIGSEDIENIWNIVNKILLLNKLGYSQIEINLKTKKIVVYHYESMFVNILKDVASGKVCEFLAVFYSNVVSSIFDMDIKFREVECKNEKSKDFCVFEMV